MEPALFRLDYISKYTQNMDILATLVREDRIKLLVDKKRPLWLQEEKDKEAGVGQPISFNGDGDEDWLDLLIETDSEEEDEEEEEEGEEKKDDSLPCLPDDFVWKKPTPEELTEQRISDYINTLRRMEIHQFTRLCVSESVLDENQVFNTIGVAHN